MIDQLITKKIASRSLISKVFLIYIVSFSYTSFVFAGWDSPGAIIHYSEFGLKEMYALKKDRVKGNLHDLEVSKKRDVKDMHLACYEGEPDGVCKLLEVAIKEENDKNNYDGDRKLKLKECITDNFGVIRVQIKSDDDHEINIASLYNCL